MATRITLDFDTMSDKAAKEVRESLERYATLMLGRRCHGGSVAQDDPDPSVGRKVTNPWSGETITCKKCGYDKFTDEGRSLDYFNHKCVKCGEPTRTMTETGMSA